MVIHMSSAAANETWGLEEPLPKGSGIAHLLSKSERFAIEKDVAHFGSLHTLGSANRLRR